MFEAFLTHFGHIDILVNNAYASHRQHFLEIDEAEWDHTLGVSLKGAFLCARAAARSMVAANRPGNIINIGSVHGHRSWANATCYGVAKAGMQRMTENMAIDLGEYGIRCNAVLPGMTDVRHHFGDEPPANGSIRESLFEAVPLRRSTTPEEIGRAVTFLCSPAASGITGTSLPIDGGMLVSAASEK